MFVFAFISKETSIIIVNTLKRTFFSHRVMSSVCTDEHTQTDKAKQYKISCIEQLCIFKENT